MQKFEVTTLPGVVQLWYSVNYFCSVQIGLNGLDQTEISSISNPRFLVQTVLVTPDMTTFDPQSKVRPSLYDHSPLTDGTFPFIIQWTIDDFPTGEVHMQKVKVK